MASVVLSEAEALEIAGACLGGAEQVKGAFGMAAAMGLYQTGNFLRQKVAQAQQTEQEVLLAKQREEAEQNAAPPAGG